MSVAEVMPPYSGDAPRQSGRTHSDRTQSDRTLADRTPPQDMEAEQCVLGAMLMSKDAIADVVEVLNLDEDGKNTREVVVDQLLVDVRSRIRNAGESLRMNQLERLPTWCSTCATCDVRSLCRAAPHGERAASAAGVGAA